MKTKAQPRDLVQGGPVGQISSLHPSQRCNRCSNANATTEYLSSFVYIYLYISTSSTLLYIAYVHLSVYISTPPAAPPPPTLSTHLSWSQVSTAPGRAARTRRSASSGVATPSSTRSREATVPRAEEPAALVGRVGRVGRRSVRTSVGGCAGLGTRGLGSSEGVGRGWRR